MEGIFSGKCACLCLYPTDLLSMYEGVGESWEIPFNHFGGPLYHPLTQFNPLICRNFPNCVDGSIYTPVSGKCKCVLLLMLLSVYQE